MAGVDVGFAVIYRWTIRVDKTEEFQEAWEKVTAAIRAQRGGLGSRLHQDEDLTWVAYAQWPDRETWEQSLELGPVDEQASAVMTEAIEKSFHPVLLTPVRDRLA